MSRLVLLLLTYATAPAGGRFNLLAKRIVQRLDGAPPI
jgi:hypothetical protein